MPGEVRRAGERTMKCRRPEVQVLVPFSDAIPSESLQPVSALAVAAVVNARRGCNTDPLKSRLQPAPSLYISKKLEVGRGNAARGMSFSS